jgi:hypothetical protein
MAFTVFAASIVSGAVYARVAPVTDVAGFEPSVV